MGSLILAWLCPNRLLRFLGFLFITSILYQLYISHASEKKTSTRKVSFQEILAMQSKINNAIYSDGTLDSSGLYKVINLSYFKRKRSSFDVTYITQCSWNKLHLIEEILQVWQGPVSVAVFTEGKYIQELVPKISVTLFCNRYKALDLFLVIPAHDVSNSVKKYLPHIKPERNETKLCSFLGKSHLERIRNYNWSVPYPINLLRNVARSGCNTDYILVADIDMLPNRDLRKNFLRYIWSRKTRPKKVAFVVPAFEMVTSIRIPQTKSEIFSEMQRGNIRPFYFVPCQQCHWLTNYRKWFEWPYFPGTRALYSVHWKHPWEPFFISYRDLPKYDERFKQYGYNRVSQACQMHMEGYTFLVLDNAFLIHDGFKSPVDFHVTKELEMNSNRKLYYKFIKEMKLKYPKSGRRCLL